MSRLKNFTFLEITASARYALYAEKARWLPRNLHHSILGEFETEDSKRYSSKNEFIFILASNLVRYLIYY